jgi:PAS domain S-box-containing protein
MSVANKVYLKDFAFLAASWGEVNLSGFRYALTHSHSQIQYNPMKDKLIRIANYFPYCMTIVDMSTEERLCIFVNDKFSDNTGYSREEGTGRNLKYLQGKDTSSETILFMRESFKNQHACIQDIINYKKDGTAFLNRLLMLPIKSGNNLFYVGFQNDITKLRGLDYHSRKLREVMDGEIRHMINNPLSIILGKMVMALERSNSEEEISKAVNELQKAFARINKFSLELETISKFEKFEYL